MINPMDLTGKRILITGASSGIGRETSILTSKLGAEVVIIARREEELQKTIDMMEGKGHKYYSFDLTNTEKIEGLIKTLVFENGVFDGFVHCAGIAPMRPLAQFKSEKFYEAININLYSFVEIVRCITKRGNINNGASIVGISSISSIKGSKSKISYCISKSGMDSAIRCMAQELANKKIRINSVQPGWVDTKLLHNYMKNYSDTNHAQNSFSRQYLGVSQTYEIANVVAFLLSDATKTLTGTSILIDGGSNS